MQRVKKLMKPNADARRNSAVTLIKILLVCEKPPTVLPEHVRELIGTLLWKITEADGKYNTRYKTRGAIECTDKSQLQHEHVYQRRKMIDLLLNANPEAADDILSEAVGCTVTVLEHNLLSKCDSEYGWDRYRRANLEVFDTVTKERKV
jgi:hypothetical protein